MKEEKKKSETGAVNKKDIIIKISVLVLSVVIVMGLSWYLRGNDVLSSSSRGGGSGSASNRITGEDARAFNDDIVEGGVRAINAPLPSDPVAPLNTKDNSVLGMGDIEGRNNTVNARNKNIVGDSKGNEVEDEIRKKVSRAKSYLRTIHVGLESYLIDYAGFPDNLYALTTPISYLTEVPLDPFDEEKVFQWTADVVDINLFIWSVGPDGVDDFGLTAYDPTNGIESAGDILRNIRVLDDITDPLFLQYFPAFTFFQKGEHKKNLERISLDFQLLTNWIYSYSSMKNKVPDNLEDLYELGLIVRELPLDPYGNGTIYRYKTENDPNNENTVMVFVYSVGPDGYDDGGAGLSLDQGFPVGDIVKNISVYVNSKAAGYKDPLLAQLQKIKAETGLDNSMIYYQEAANLNLPLPENEPLSGTLENGWSADSEPLLAYFEMYADAFDLIRAGVDIDNVAFPDPSILGPATPVPNYLSAQIKSKLLCAQGQYFESLGQYDRALENYLVALQMGNDYGAEDSILIGGLISFAVKNIACEQIYDSVGSGQLSLDQLLSAGYILREVDNSNLPLTAYIDSEHDTMMGAHDLIIEEIEKARDDSEKMDEMLQGFGGNKKMAEDFIANPEKYLKMMDEFHEETMDFYSQPMWERDYDDWQETVEWWSERNPLIAISLPNYEQAETRLAVSDANMSIVRTAVALEQYKYATGAYPAHLSSLTPYLLDEIRDPFTGRELCYENKGGSFILYSVGPDKTDGHGKNIYDPVNGSISNGDIIFQSQ